MKLLAQYTTPHSLLEAKSLLERNGIPTFTGNANTFDIAPGSPGHELGLFVLSLEQYEDAEALLSDSSHRVRGRLTEAQTDALDTSYGSSEQHIAVEARTIPRWLSIAVLAVAAVALVVQLINLANAA